MTSTILGIDPGEKTTGWVIVHGIDVIDFGQTPNTQFVDTLCEKAYDLMLIEELAYARDAGRAVMRTAMWSGAFLYSGLKANREVRLFPRTRVKTVLCKGVRRAKDRHVSAAVRQFYRGTGGGSRPQVGTSKQPGPLYGITSHCWQALALVIAWRIDRNGEILARHI